MDKFPITEGQALIIGKKHVDYIFDLDDGMYLHLFGVAKKVGKAVDSGLGTIRTWIVVQGMEVPHVHVKLFPIYEGKYVNLNEGSGKMADDDYLEDLAKKIKDYM
jgi:histidine triad (HIT) family protein